MPATVLPRKDYTAEEALYLHPPGRWELRGGEIVFVSPAGFRHGRIVTRVARVLDEFVSAHRLGVVVSGDAGFVLGRAPDSVRAPDVAFLKAARVPHPPPAEFFEGAPDLAIEVMSPSDRWIEVDRKANEFLTAGSIAVWALDPDTRSARTYQPGRTQVINQDGALEDSELLPRFSLRLTDVFE